VLQATAAKPTVKLHLAAIRMVFDRLVVGQVLAVNAARAVACKHSHDRALIRLLRGWHS
jgi:hypothetical protein